MKKEVIYLIFYHQLMVGKWQFLWRHLRNPGSSGSEGSVDAGMNGIVAETSVEKLVMGLGNDGGQGGGGPLPGQHLVLDLADLLLEVPGGGVHSLPDAGVVQLGFSLTCGTKNLLTFQCTHVVCPEFCLLSQGDVGCMNFEWHLESEFGFSERANWRLVNVNLRWAKKASSSVSGPSIICWYQQWPKCGQVCIMRSCLTQARSQPEILHS